jgi:hypothetical protein
LQTTIKSISDCSDQTCLQLAPYSIYSLLSLINQTTIILFNVAAHLLSHIAGQPTLHQQNRKGIPATILLQTHLCDYAANYAESPHPLKQSNDSIDNATELIQLSIENFIDSLKHIVSQAKNSKIDYYFVLSKMKNSDFFSEVPILIGRSQPSLNRN